MMSTADNGPAGRKTLARLKPGNAKKQPKKKGCPQAAFSLSARFLAVEHVHRDFKTKAHFGVFGFRPHGKAPIRES
jgi:hypothetical protein